MGQAVAYSHTSGISNSSISSGGGGGNVDDILKRLGKVEESVGDLKTQVGVIAAAMPLLATAASVAEAKLATTASIAELRTEVRAIAAVIPHLATAASVFDLKSEMSTMETRIIKWIVATALAS